jgi:hypothetical protein
MKNLILSALCAVMCGGIIAADVNYTQLRTRIVGRELINNGQQVVYKFQQGDKTWAKTNLVRKVTAPRIVRYSKLKLILAAKAAGKWVDVKQFLAANDMLDEWNACQYLTSDNPIYTQATNAVISASLATPEELAAFLKLAED